MWFGKEPSPQATVFSDREAMASWKDNGWLVESWSAPSRRSTDQMTKSSKSKKEWLTQSWSKSTSKKNEWLTESLVSQLAEDNEGSTDTQLADIRIQIVRWNESFS